MKKQHNYKNGYRKKEPRLEDELVATLISISVVARSLAKKVMIQSLKNEKRGKSWAR
jgi:hypothetical protein